MRIVHVTLRFDAPGGVETTTREVTRRLRDRGHDVVVFASDLYDEASWDRSRSFAPTVDGVPVRRFPVFRRLVPGITMPMFDGLVGALAHSGADVIHAHSHRYGHVLQSALAARAKRIPFVVSTHYHPADRRQSAWKRGLLRVQDVGFGATAYRIADRLVVETAIEADRVREFAPGEKLVTIPPGIDLAPWDAPANGGGVPGGPYVLYAGRVAANKGLDVLLDAIARMPPNVRPAVVIMGRDWGERTRLEQRAQANGIAAGVTFLGHVDDPARYRAVVRGARAFVLPSEWEAYGLVLLEAMAAGVPIVATDVGGIPEVVEGGRSGRLVPFGDADALAAALRSVLNDPGVAHDLVDAGRRRVGTLTWDRAVDHHEAMYRAIVAR